MKVIAYASIGAALVATVAHAGSVEPPADGSTLGITSDDAVVSCDAQGNASAFAIRNGWSIREPYFGKNTDGKPMKCLALSREALSKRLQGGNWHLAPVSPDRPAPGGSVPVVDNGALEATLASLKEQLATLQATSTGMKTKDRQ
ncbi:hypothetical protein [Burkholderia cenocepacia]|uniref:hypothetical protein n=1 Tax=Burkholderia cenocepacia TaxID=95486 RepID=UPI001903403C|nr:hypothetical protein [Burkholderia cenocepacia]MBJ9920509.1 hypothetical protein [Burkholderia cenocepacia]